MTEPTDDIPEAAVVRALGRVLPIVALKACLIKGRAAVPRAFVGVMLSLLASLVVVDGAVEAACLDCHPGTAFIPNATMADDIRALAARHGDATGCATCHGGNPAASDRAHAHSGAPEALTRAGGPDAFYPDPGVIAVADRTCGQCHGGYTARVRKSIMGTDAETISRNLCAAAAELRKKRHGAPRPFGRYVVRDDDGPEPVTGSADYRRLIHSLMTSAPTFFADRLFPMPDGEFTERSGVADASCDRCHREHGALRAQLGCSSCHRHSGADLRQLPSAERTGPTANTVNQTKMPDRPHPVEPERSGTEWAHIPRETCFGCHFDPRTVGVNEMGDAFVHYGAPHHVSTGGLLCQDCHTSLEMHGDGNIALTTRAQNEVRCEDCHGTTRQYPWELPLGYAGPREPEPRSVAARGTASDANAVPDKAVPPGDGYLLTSRGNPFGNVVRDGDRVVLYSAAGFTYPVTLLKSLVQTKSWRSTLSQQVKSAQHDHDKMACLDCHSEWSPPCLGCHVKSAAP